MMKHPFDKEAVEAANKAMWNDPNIGDKAIVALQAAWDSMFARGRFICDLEKRTFIYIAKDKCPE